MNFLGEFLVNIHGELAKFTFLHFQFPTEWKFTEQLHFTTDAFVHLVGIPTAVLNHYCKFLLLRKNAARAADEFSATTGI